MLLYVLRINRDVEYFTFIILEVQHFHEIVFILLFSKDTSIYVSSTYNQINI